VQGGALFFYSVVEVGGQRLREERSVHCDML
jgi:hypothetical protein